MNRVMRESIATACYVAPAPSADTLLPTFSGSLRIQSSYLSSDFGTAGRQWSLPWSPFCF